MKTTTKRTIAGLLCGVLAVTAVAGAGTALYMGAKNNGWFEKETEIDSTLPDGEEKTETANTIDSEGGIIASKTTANGISLSTVKLTAEEYEDYGISVASVDSAYTVTATVSPSDYTGTITYSVAWANPSSTWASGKSVSSYVTLSQTSGSTSATVTCLQAFGEQIILTATADDGYGASATATFDYVKRISSITLKIGSTNGTLATASSSSTAYTYTLSPTYGTGTVTGIFATTDYGITLKLSDAFLSKMTASGYALTSSTSSTIVSSSTGWVNGNSYNALIVGALTFCASDSDSKQAKYLNDFITAANYCANNTNYYAATISAGYEYSYSATGVKGSYSTTGTATVNVNFDVSALAVAATDISLSYSGFVF